MKVSVRRAEAGDAAAIAHILLNSRESNPATIPAMVHAPSDVLDWVTRVVLPLRSAWVACDKDSAVGVLVLDDRWIDQLYLLGSATGQGVGAELVRLAKQLRPDGLELWTFQSNLGALRFYARHGFVEVERTDGTGNEEHAPDVRMVWRPDP